MKRMNHFLTEKQLKKLEELSKASGISKAEIIRRALDNYLRKENAKERIS